MELTPTASYSDPASNSINQPVTRDYQSILSNPTIAATDNNSTELIPFFCDNFSSVPPPVRTTSEIVEDVIHEQIIVAICALGLIGNLLNLLVLCQKSLLVNMERMERSANYGLVGLALSDALLCVVTLPTAVVGTKQFGYRFFSFRIVYAVYSQAVTNTFVLSSTWLTVCMAVSRYLVVCYPFKARLLIGKRFAITSLAYVFLASVVFNVPRYFLYEIGSLECAEGGFYYYKMLGALTSSEGDVLYLVYKWIAFIVGIALPFAILAFCNVKLIVALQRSARMSGKNLAVRNGEQDNSGKNRITLMMILIVAFYICLVVPAETCAFVQDVATSDWAYLESFELATAILNLFQAINFAFNFLLYCAVNAYFRQTFLRLIRCVGVGKFGSSNLAMQDQQRRRGTDYSVGYVSTCRTDGNATTV